jgi:hypothetical protein
MKKILLTVAYCFFATISFCQDQYYQSSIIKNDGSKVEGYISNLYDAKAIKFKKTLKSEPILYTPANLNGFVLVDNLFETKIVTIFHYKYGASSLGALGEVASELTIDTAQKQTKDTVFCQKILAGTVNLYKLRYTDNAQYLFVEKNNVIREVPRQYYITEMSASAKTDVTGMLLRKSANLNYTTFEYRTYLDTLALVCNDAQIKPFNYSEKKIISTVAAYNKRMGTPNGGFVKKNIPQKIFFGGSVGKIAWKRDENFKYEPTDYSIAAKGYILKPLVGINRNTSAKLGINYFVYGNNRRSMTIASASIGFRYGSTKGIVRPYIEGSIAVSEQFLNNKPYTTLIPTILEVGVIAPIRDFYITANVNISPVKYSPQNGYKLMAWEVGIMF